MEILKQLNLFTKTLLIAALSILLYGYLCRLTGIYFFWESKTVGWTLLFIGIGGFLFNRIKIKKAENEKAIGEKIALGLIAFGLLIQAIFIVVIPITDAYSAAITHLTYNKNLKAEVGNIQGFGLIPIGGTENSEDTSGRVEGYAEINLIVKGDKKFKDVTIYLIKQSDSPEWEVVGVE